MYFSVKSLNITRHVNFTAYLILIRFTISSDKSKKVDIIDFHFIPFAEIVEKYKCARSYIACSDHDGAYSTERSAASSLSRLI